MVLTGYGAALRRFGKDLGWFGGTSCAASPAVGPPGERTILMNKSPPPSLTRLTTRDRGATAVEYGLLVALIAAVIVAIVLVLGRQVSTAFQSVSESI